MIAFLASAGIAGFAGKFFLIGSFISLGALRPDRECEAMNALSHKASIIVATIFPISLKKKWENEKMGWEKFVKLRLKLLGRSSWFSVRHSQSERAGINHYVEIFMKFHHWTQRSCTISSVYCYRLTAIWWQISQSGVQQQHRFP